MVFPWKILLLAGLFFLLDLLFPLSMLFRPSVGVSVAALFLWGPRAWPCAALGSLLSGLFLEHAWMQVVVDATVDTGQSLLAWTLVRRYIGLPAPLFKTSQLLAYHCLIGPVAMGVGTLVRTLVHLACSISLPYSVGSTILYNWAAQSFGVVLASTILLSCFHQDYPWNRRRASVALPILVLLAMTFYARWLVELRVEALESVTLSRQADQLAKEYQWELRASGAILKATAGFFGASETVRPAELERFLHSVVRGRPEPLALLWVSRPPKSSTLTYPMEQSGGRLVALLRESDAVKKRLKRIDATESIEAEVIRTDSEEVPLYLLSVPTFDARGEFSGVVVAAFDLNLLTGSALANTVENPDIVLSLRLEGEDDLPSLVGPAQPTDHSRRNVLERYEMEGLVWTVQAARRSMEPPRLGVSLGLLMAVFLMFLFIRLSNQTTRIELLKRDIESRADILRGLNLELERAAEAARRIDQAKSLFLANISHEIRTPMNGILGLTRLVLDSPLGSAQKEQLRHVELSARNLLALFNDILDVSTIEGNQAALDLRPQSLSELLEETARQLSLQAEEKSIELILSCDNDLSERLVIDGLKLRQVLLNLVGNALKFTPAEGEVELEVMTVERKPTSVCLKFLVRDSGVGIANDQLRKIFEPFVQVEGSRPLEGSGLGLAISRALVERMGGRLEVQSRPGTGSTFSFALECDVVPSPPSVFRDAPTAELSIYLHMNHPRHESVVREYLTQWGFSLVSEPAAAGLLLVDGIDVLPTGRDGSKAIVILSISELTRDLERCLRCDAVPLLKPFSRASLCQSIQQALAPSTQPHETSSDKICDRRYTGKRALVVDDNLTNRLLATLLFQRMGFQADSVEDGESALRVAARRSYDVVLLDLRLPGLDGYRVAASLRELGVRVPIIAATAHTQENCGEGVRQAGMDGFLTKPISESLLRAKVSELVSPAPTLELDFNVLLRSVGGDNDSAREVALGFLQEVSELTGALRRAASTEELAHSCHTLKGAVKVFGMESLSRRLEHWELRAEGGESLDCSLLWEEIEPEVSELTRALREFSKEAGSDAEESVGG